MSVHDLHPRHRKGAPASQGGRFAPRHQTEADLPLAPPMLTAGSDPWAQSTEVDPRDARHDPGLHDFVRRDANGFADPVLADVPGLAVEKRAVTCGSRSTGSPSATATGSTARCGPPGRSWRP